MSNRTVRVTYLKTNSNAKSLSELDGKLSYLVEMESCEVNFNIEDEVVITPQFLIEKITPTLASDEAVVIYNWEYNQEIEHDFITTRPQYTWYEVDFVTTRPQYTWYEVDFVTIDNSGWKSVLDVKGSFQNFTSMWKNVKIEIDDRFGVEPLQVAETIVDEYPQILGDDYEMPYYHSSVDPKLVAMIRWSPCEKP